MAEFLQHLVNGLSLGSIYALITLGYTMVFGVLQLINFAHGDVYMLGAFTGLYAAKYFFPQQSSVFVLLAVMAMAMFCCGLVGFTIERVAYRPLRQSPRINSLITAVGVSMLLEFSGQLIFGSDPEFFPQLMSGTMGSWSIGALKINPMQVIVMGIALSLMAVLQYIIFYTSLGRAMRAVSFNHELAGLMGVPVNRVISATFVLGSSLAGAAGVLVGVIYPKIEPLMGVMPGLKCFVAAVLGGIGNVAGAVVGALFLGLAEELLVGYWAPSYRDALAFALLILVLLVRPRGLFPVQRTEKV